MAVLAPLAVPTATGVVRARFTSRLDGDVSVDRIGPDEASRRWTALAGVPVTWLDQRHADTVVDVAAPGEHCGRAADAAVSAACGLGLAVWVGDCAPVLLVADEGPFGVVHAGWRGLAAGVLERAVTALRRRGGRHVSAWLGPCIRPCCYEFGADELRHLGERWPAAVAGRTAWGTPALDVPAAVGAVLGSVGVDRLTDGAPCTGCDDDYWSHRRRGDVGRHGLVAWRAAP